MAVFQSLRMQDNTSQTPPRIVPRRRASKACLACRSRKVRCDAVLRDGQCTNCALDGQQCLVKPRPSKYRSSKRKSTANHEGSGDRQTEPLQKQQQQEQQQLFISDPFAHNLVNDGSMLWEKASDHSPFSPSASCGGSWGQSEISQANLYCRTPAQMRNRTPSILSTAIDSRNNEIASDINPASANASLGTTVDTHVIYSYFPFLEIDLSLMSQHDAHFLETQGCFKVPGRQALDEFVREYFLHVHPSLPLLDESIFWDTYSQTGRSTRNRVPLSLFVFQAMLFASCSFLSLATVRTLGFTSARNARATYYRRAKLLFDFAGETNPVANAQGALLLSYNASMREHKRTNSLWLATAIQMSEGAGAHRFYLRPIQAPNERIVLKRLWWCCIVRDRILSLGVRRQLQIPLAGFDSEDMALAEEDFENEIGNSQVYDTETKRSLIRLFITLCDLAVPLTDVIMTIYPSRGPINIRLSTDELLPALDRVQSCKHGLQSWFEKATIRFPTPAGILSPNESLILYTNLMYMYYHSARLALYQHEALILASRSPGLEDEENKLRQSRIQLEDAAAGITDNLKELIQLKLARFLPISVVAYAALPFVLHILDVKLSTSPSQIAQKQGRLNIYMEAMKGLQSQYDGTDEVWEFIRAIVDYTTARNSEQEPSRPTLGDGSTSKHADFNRSLSSRASMSITAASDWGHILLMKPTLYFRATHAIDLSLSTGCYPEDCEFPLVLKTPCIPVGRIAIGDLSHGYRSNQDAGYMDQQEFTTDTRNSALPNLQIPGDLGNFVNHIEYGHGDLGIPSFLDAFDLNFGEGVNFC